MFNKKLKKLIRDPKLFLSDMAKNQKNKINKVKSKQSFGHTDYTVISAVYNVGNYLDDYFQSFIKQNLDFKNNIYLILVDDGSVDNSAEIIKKWVKKYPNNITYIYKQNGGQASARNLGLQHVNSEWVTFIDPDDFLNSEYFSNIDLVIKKNEDIKLDLISCNLIPYFEDTNQYKDNHPLRYRYNYDGKLFRTNDLGKQIQLSASTAFFRNSIIQAEKIEFNDQIKPSFEDAAFVASYLYYADGYAVYVKNSKYFYRKRSDGSSTLDRAWEHPGLYSVVLHKGCLESMMKYVRAGKEIPESLQITILYHMIWYIKRLVNNEHKLAILSNKQRDEFKSLVYEILSMIDDKIILGFSLAGSWFYHKVGILSQFKKNQPPFQIVYIESYDHIKKLVQLRYFTGSPALEFIQVDGEERLPIFVKTISHDFLSEKFIDERRIWIPLENDEKLKVTISNKKTTISLAGQQKQDGFFGSDISKYFKGQRPKYTKNKKFLNSWVFMDRDIQADDNAEHLYRYVKNNHKTRRIFFVLKKESHDWSRLQHEGFNLIAFGTPEHEDALKTCTKVISSHADHCVTNYLGSKMLHGRHFVFLQHGVTKDDLSNWLNQKDNIDCFITASYEEYKSISGEQNHYKYSEKEVVFTGFPRHDNLLNIGNKNPKTILIMPTWRSSIVGAPTKGGLQRTVNNEFSDTDFFKKWNNILKSDKLKQLAVKYGYSINFFPHVNITPYLSLFETPEYIHVLEHSDIRIQDLFKKSSLLITDYSSVAFDMAIQNKQTIYYQFDEDKVFNGNHTYSRGYYDYRKDGFGPVVINEDDLFIELNKLLDNNAIPSSVILDRIHKTFKLRDGMNCERTYHAITALDEPLSKDFLNTDIAIDYALRATQHKSWELARTRWEFILNIESSIDKQKATLKLIEAIRESGKIDECINKFEHLKNDNNIYFEDDYYIEQAKVYMACHQWLRASQLWSKISFLDTDNQLLFIECLAEIGSLDKNTLNLNNTLTNETKIIYEMYKRIDRRDWKETIEHIKYHYYSFSKEQVTKYKLDLVLARCYRENHDFTNAQLQLIEYQRYAKHDIQHRYEIAKLAFINNQWNKVVSQIEIAGITPSYLPQNLVIIYLTSLRKINNSAISLEILNTLPLELIESNDMQIEKAEIYLEEKQWSNAAASWIELLGHCEFAPYRLAFSYRMLGMIDEAFTVLLTEGIRPPACIEEWILRAEISHLSTNWKEASYCWSKILSAYPDVRREDIWSRLHEAQVMESLTSAKLKSSNLN